MISYFTDPVLRAPTLGCILMCLASSLMGVISFLKKRSLVGESLSHAAYPGIVIGLGIYAAAAIQGEGLSLLFAIGGALLCSILGLRAIHWLEKKGKVKSDAALCFMLSSFFGLGIFSASYIQGAYPAAIQQAQLYLYGQAATMTDAHVVLYGILALVVVGFLTISYRPLQAVLFDSHFAESAGLMRRGLSLSIFFLLLLSIVVGIRSVGVVLMSGMLIAPAVAARQFTNRLSCLFCLAGLFGVLSGFLGNVLSVEGSLYLSQAFPGQRFSLPTGPMIVLVGSFFAFFALLFAPERGILFRIIRVLRFKQRCTEENILKAIWKKEKGLSLYSIKQMNHLSPPSLTLLLWRLSRQGWIANEQGIFVLTSDGSKRAARIVRLHRLWEVYLANLGWPEEQVHRTAEEMEHILTPELEEELATQLCHPKVDPHAQPIPEKR